MGPLRASLMSLISSLAVPAQAGAAEATMDQRVAVCAILAAPLVRLQCYDAVAGRVEEAAPKTDSIKTQWTVQDDESPLDRSRRVILTKLSINSDTYGTEAVIGARCIEGKTSFIVMTPDYLGGDHASVQYRIGDMAPVEDEWFVGGDRSNVVFGPEGGSAIAFIKRIAEAKDFVIRLSPRNGANIDYQFDVAGLAPLVDLLSTTCKWPSAPPKQIVPPK